MSAARTAKSTRPVKQATKASSPERVDVTQLLRQRIANHELAPGTKLTEMDLAAEFGVPRPRVREALAALEQRGLVERTHNKGTVVTRLELGEVLAIYEAREALEGLAVRLATERSPKGHRKELLRHFTDEMPRLLADGKLDEVLSGYELFRDRVFAAANNTVIQSMVDSILERTQMVIRRAVILPGRAERGLMQHQAVLRAMDKGDAAEAERLRKLNMSEAADFVRRYHKFVI
jgi:DNA-binding GntR family transcriptional regulator